MDGVMMPSGSRGMAVEAARQCRNDRKEWRAMVHTYLVACVSRGPICLNQCSF